MKLVLTPVNLAGTWMLVRAPRTRIGASRPKVRVNTPPKRHRRAVSAPARVVTAPQQPRATTLLGAMRGMATGAVRWVRRTRKAA